MSGIMIVMILIYQANLFDLIVAKTLHIIFTRKYIQSKTKVYMDIPR